MRRLLLVAASLVFAGFGAYRAWPARILHPPAARGPLLALEKHAAYGAGDPHALTRLTEALGKLPAGRPLLVVRTAGSETAAIAAQVVSYVFWPRPMESIEPGPGVHLESLASLRAKYAAVVLCGPRAPADYPGVLRAGPRLEVIEGSALHLP